MRDFILAVRMFRKSFGFTVVAVATLALGVGANTAIFSVVKAVLLNQLPYREPERLVGLAEADAGTIRPVTVDFTTTYDLRKRSRSFESMSLYRDWRSALIGEGDPELAIGLRVGYDYFDTLGIKMQRGRTFLPEEDRADRWRTVLIISDGLWTRRFGRDPNIVGRKVGLNESTFTIVGVLPADFQPVPLGQSETPRDIFAPLGYELGGPSSSRGKRHLRLIARLKAGVEAGAANAEINAAMAGIVREHPEAYTADQKMVLTPLRQQIFGQVRKALWVLLGAVSLVPLIACANVANLLLARASGRAKEIALRTALGAGRGRLIRQMLTESLVLALAGGIGGVLLAAVGTTLVASIAPREIPRIAEVKVDVTVLLFGLGASLLAGLLFGLAPALRLSRTGLADSLKDAGRSTGGRGANGLRHVLVTMELALAFVLVAGAGLLGKSFIHLMNIDPGFDPHNLLTLNTYVYSARYAPTQAALNYTNQVLDRLRATPGIESAAMVSTLPLTSFDRTSVHIQDRPLANPNEAPAVDRYSITPDYFHAMRIPLKSGRGFGGQDREGAPLAAIVSESCARRLFPKESAIGKHIQLGGRDDTQPWMTIVGVVGDVRQYGLDRAPSMEAYLPQAQNLNFNYMAVARTTGDPRRMEGAVRDAFMAVDKTQPIFAVAPMETYLASSLAARRFTLAMLGFFGVLALTLAAIGVYGVISYSVSLRTREIGIRMALGAKWGDVVKMMLRQGMGLAAAGLAAGFAVSLGLTRFLSSLLFEVHPTDLATLFGVAVLLAAVAMAGSYVPARRAAKVDPMNALRLE